MGQRQADGLGEGAQVAVQVGEVGHTPPSGILACDARTLLITGIAAVSFGGAAAVPVAVLARKTQKELKDSGYTCEHTATDFTVCTDSNGHEWYCEESTDKCEQIKLEGHKPRIAELVPSVGVLKAPEAGSPPPTRVATPRLASAGV